MNGHLRGTKREKNEDNDDIESYSKAKSYDGDIITIESSDDEGVVMQSLIVEKKNDAENKLLLVYPFDIDEEMLSEASRGLLELGGNMLGVQPILDDQPDEDDVTVGTRLPPRTHNVIIRDEEYGRLSPGQFLNDTLVDFWMQW